MLQRIFQLTVGLGMMALACAAASQPTVTVRDLELFSHQALIPADSDLASIRIERVKLVKAPTGIQFVNGGSYCEQEQSFGEPGGSAYCSSFNVEKTEQAYELKYSYSSRPMTSDEYGGRNFTLSIYFRPEELSAEVRQQLSKGKVTPALAELFDVTTTRLLQERTVIDESNSRFCNGSYVDGSWLQKDRDCKDQIQVKPLKAPGDYIAVQVSSQLSKKANR